MADEEEPSRELNFFKRFFDCVNSQFLRGDDTRVNNPCKPGQKSFVGSLFDRKSRRQEQTSSNDFKCDDKVAKVETEKQVEVQEDSYQENECEEVAPDVHEEPCCFILEQNPLRPCCCELKTNDDEDDDGCPCPPSGYPVDPPAPSCGCDLCRKSGYHGRCCDRRTYVQGTGAEDLPQLERA